MGVLRALRWPAYRRVWLTATLMQFGYWFSSISFQWLVARETDNDPLSLSILYFSMLVPMTVFSLPAGVLADVRDRRRVLLLAQLGILTLSTVTATLVFLDRAPFQVLLACGFAGGLVHVLAIPSSQALAANAVPTEDLRSGVLIQAAGMNLARIVGPAVAGVLILAWGAVESLVTYGAIAVLTLVALRGLRNIPGNAAPVARQGLATRIWSGVNHARAHPPAGTALVIVGATSVFGLSYYAQLPALAARVSPDPSIFLMLATIGAVGSAAGVLVVALRPAGPPTVTPAALMLAVQSLVVLGLAVSTRLWLTVALVVIGGAMQFGIMTHCNTVVQAVVDDDHRGRVMSIYVLCWGGSLPLGGLLLGTVWHLVGPTIALGASGLVALSIAAYTLRASTLCAGTPVPRPVPADL